MDLRPIWRRIDATSQMMTKIGNVNSTQLMVRQIKPPLHINSPQPPDSAGERTKVLISFPQGK